MKEGELEKIEAMFNKNMLNTLIKFSIIVILAIACDRIFSPFWNIMLWALVLAVSLYPLHQLITRKIGGKEGAAAVVVVVGMISLVGVPAISLGDVLSQEIIETHENFVNGTMAVPPPAEILSKVPGPGKKVYDLWSLAHSDFPTFVEKVKPYVGEITQRIFDQTKNIISSLFVFIASMAVAGLMMAYGKSGSQAMLNVFTRFVGDAGANYRELSVKTMRSVALGVLGVAFIQALLLGIGFAFADIPGAGILALITLLFGIMQIPAAIISLPAIAYLWVGGDASVTSNIIWTIYIVIAGLSDNVLKPILLGRGVDAPMPVILLGALGGMFTAGIIGMFLGAVGLALSYQLFMTWVNEDVVDIDATEVAE